MEKIESLLEECIQEKNLSFLEEDLGLEQDDLSTEINIMDEDEKYYEVRKPTIEVKIYHVKESD
ncbi:hypothetical protein MASR1M68_14840 [Elusimicrobiota bacterium]